MSSCRCSTPIASLSRMDGFSIGSVNPKPPTRHAFGASKLRVAWEFSKVVGVSNVYNVLCSKDTSYSYCLYSYSTSTFKTLTKLFTKTPNPMHGTRKLGNLYCSYRLDILERRRMVSLICWGLYSTSAESAHDL